MATDIDIVKAALLIVRPTSPYSSLAWIADVRAAVSHLLPADRVDEVLVRLHNRYEAELRRADLVRGVEVLAKASELKCISETWHYAGLVEAL